MKQMPVKLIVCALAVSLLVLPADLVAKQKRGATLLITKLDGTQVSGELIAVKPETLLLLVGGAMDLSVPLVDIQTVRIVRKSRSGAAAGIGAAAGFIGGAAIVLGGFDSLEGPFESRAQGVAIVGVITAGLGALAGLLVGSAAGADSTFTAAGQPEAILADYWSKLRAYSREGRLKRPAPMP
jgi:hypothetical protein